MRTTRVRRELLALAGLVILLIVSYFTLPLVVSYFTRVQTQEPQPQEPLPMARQPQVPQPPARQPQVPQHHVHQPQVPQPHAPKPQVSQSTVLQPQLDLKTKELQITLLNSLLDGVNKVLEYFSSSFTQINSDALFCSRLCQGSLIGALEDCNSSRLLCSREVKKTIQAVNARLNSLVDTALPYVQKQNPIGVRAFGELLTGAFIIKQVPEYLSNITSKTRMLNDYQEEQGSLCIINLLGNDNTGRVQTMPRCTVRDNCWLYMTRELTGEYYLTHQVLYTMIGERVRCEGELQQRLRLKGSSIRDFQRYLCGQVYLNAEFLNQFGDVYITEQDLFMEQITFCGMLGFQNLLRESWIPMILGWQTPEGCFSNTISRDETFRHEQKRGEDIETRLEDTQEIKSSSHTVS